MSHALAKGGFMDGGGGESIDSGQCIQSPLRLNWAITVLLQVNFLCCKGSVYHVAQSVRPCIRNGFETMLEQEKMLVTCTLSQCFFFLSLPSKDFNFSFTFIFAIIKCFQFGLVQSSFCSSKESVPDVFS